MFYMDYVIALNMSPLGPRGLKTRIGPPNPQRVVKGD